MPESSGRVERRIRLAVPVEIFSVQDPSARERSATENVCSVGARLVTRRPKELNERLMIRSFGGELRTLARVVYCQRLSDGRFGVGIQFLGKVARGTRDSTSGPVT